MAPAPGLADRVRERRAPVAWPARIAALHEGGAFIIPWLIFLFTWSIPILIAEFTLGKTTRRGPIGAFAGLLSGSAGPVPLLLAGALVGVAARTFFG